MYALKFNQKIATTATQPISVNDLLKRLKALASELEGLEQENIHRASLTKIATQLVSPNLLGHKNKGITAFTACCIADILRLCAPDAPYSAAQLKSIFECFIKQLKGLGDVDGTYYQQYFYLLESLATVESIVLLGDIDKGDQMTVDIFRLFFDLVTDEQHRQNTEEHMTSVMTKLIDELRQLPGELLEILLAQLIRPKKHDRLHKKQESTANTMAKTIFSCCADRLQRTVCQYFTDVICDTNEQIRDSDGQENGHVSDNEQLRVAHNLVYELFESAPSTLQNVIPQLENELNVESVLCRSLALQTISNMLASPNGEVLLTQYTSTYKAWASRRNDKSVVIRAKWIEGIGQILGNVSGAIRLADVEQLCIDGLITRLVDPDERVRSAACHVIENLDYGTAKVRLTTGVLKTYSDRCRDRKPAAQEAAFRHIGKLFSSAYPDIASGDAQVTQKFAPLVNYILHCLYVNDMGINVLLEKTIYDDLLGHDEDDNLRARRALTVLKLADDKSRRAFFAIVGQLQKATSQYLDHYLKCCDKYNGGTIDKSASQIREHLSGCIKVLAQRLPNPTMAETDLMTFASANDRRSYKLMRDCISPANDFRSVRKAMKECLKRASQISAQVRSTIEIILTRASFQFINRSIVTPISAIGHESADEFSELSQLVLREISEVHPVVYRAHIEPLTAQIVKDPLAVSMHSIKALAHFVRKCPGDMPNDDTLLKALQGVLLGGTPKQAKQAVTIVCSISPRPDYLQSTLNNIIDNLDYDNENFLTQLATIAQVNLIAPELLESRADGISTFCAKELLTQTRTVRDEADNEEWREDDSVSKECSAKCYALRILVNRLRAYHAADTAKELARPVFKALRSIVASMGELSSLDETPLYVRSRLRLEAGKLILKLACFPTYESLIDPVEFTQVAIFAQDFEYNVRKAFLARLQKSLATQKLPARWHVIVFLAAHDPEEEIKQELKRRVNLLNQQHNGKDYLMESMMPRLIHLLAHHPDLSTEDRDDSDLVNFSVYFSFYFDTIATADNLVLIYHYCQRIKQVADALSQEPHNTNNIYILSDIAQIIFATKAEQHNWPLLAYPKKLKLPTDLYRALPSSSDANANQTRSFLTEEQRELIKAQVFRSSKTPKAKVNSDQVEPEPSTPKKRSKDTRTRSKKRTRRGSLTSSTPFSERRASTRTKKVVDYGNNATDSEKSESEELSSSESE